MPITKEEVTEYLDSILPKASSSRCLQDYLTEIAKRRRALVKKLRILEGIEQVFREPDPANEELVATFQRAIEHKNVDESASQMVGDANRSLVGKRSGAGCG